MAKGATANVARALEESLCVLHPKTLRARYVTNMRAYMNELMTDERCILGTRKDHVQRTKLEEGKEAEMMTTKVYKETTKFDKWCIRQMLRGVETICTLTEFASQDEPILNTVMLYHVLMTGHEEKVLVHLKTVDYTNADIAKACTLFPYHQAIHKLDNKNKIAKPVYVPEMFADAIVELAIQTTAGMKTAQLVDATAWAPKQMRRSFKKIQDYMHQNMETPDWVTEIRSKRAKEASDLDEQGKADAWKRTGGAAPGESGGLANV